MVSIMNVRQTFNEIHDRVKAEENAIEPQHYLMYPITPAEYCYKNKLDFLSSNVIKYTTRFRQKGKIEDLRKAKKYLEMLADWEYGEEL